MLQFIEACVKYCDVLEKIKPLTDQQNEMAELVETATRQKEEAEAKVRDASICALVLLSPHNHSVPCSMVVALASCDKGCCS